VLAKTNVQAVNAAVAEHVRTLRLARSWSLDELSGRSGVSKGMVVQIEGARTNPSVGTLCRIADAFGITPAELLAPAADRAVRISNSEDSPLLWRGGYGGFGRLLGGVNDPDFVELWEWRLAPGDEHESPEHTPGTHELLHVLAGTVTVTIDERDYVVTAGQTAEFRADHAHRYRNDGSAIARAVVVVVIPTG